jgi:UDP-2,3-diacylglucosamine hydrolase
LGLLDDDVEKRRELQLVRFLNSIKGDAKKLFILGDLFDYWFEYKKVIQKGFYRTFTALSDLSDAGVEIHYFIGNHDFLHSDFFKNDIGVIVHEENYSIDLEEKKFYLGHGDGLVRNDYGYLILKKIFRNKFIQKLYALIHPDLGISIASSTSKKSRDYTSTKSYGEIDGVFDAAKKKIDEGYDYVIFGHTHNRTLEKYNSGFYVNLGTWLTGPGYGIFTNGKFEIIDIVEE